MAGDLHAGIHMVLRWQTLSNIVKQQGQIKQLGLLQLRQEFRIALVPLRGGLRQAMQAINRQEGVLIDGKAVVVIPDHEGVNVLELRQHQGEKTESVHGA